MVIKIIPFDCVINALKMLEIVQYFYKILKCSHANFSCYLKVYDCLGQPSYVIPFLGFLKLCDLSAADDLVPWVK